MASSILASSESSPKPALHLLKSGTSYQRLGKLGLGECSSDLIINLVLGSPLRYYADEVGR